MDFSVDNSQSPVFRYGDILEFFLENISAKSSYSRIKLELLSKGPGSIMTR